LTAAEKVAGAGEKLFVGPRPWESPNSPVNRDEDRIRLSSRRLSAPCGRPALSSRPACLQQSLLSAIWTAYLPPQPPLARVPCLETTWTTRSRTRRLFNKLDDSLRKPSPSGIETDLNRRSRQPSISELRISGLRKSVKQPTPRITARNSENTE